MYTHLREYKLGRTKKHKGKIKQKIKVRNKNEQISKSKQVNKNDPNMITE